ncbi:MAG: TetR family transcriptional regulator [Rhodococcus sp.]|uniref:TetR/AcrR family transcriptional regulator n=1 Tax=Rhodococcus sp. TaxID=1831 RepID=UPI0016B7FE67|nr:TetR/AcrR family transcriptional regulator [Rhodococcus sp. (in: high G+C Gram-positive bacteria)]NLV79665.1 TetR family transcriptional regulator [Rhodococcus sp. (in: high G+C Gram-positive bacteria)]
MTPPAEAASPSRAPSLRERRKQETRLEITRAALELFEAQGSAVTTVDEIARRAGVSPSTFFRCFATKEESVYINDRDFEAEVLDWLAATPAEKIDLDGVEALHERSLRRLTQETDETRDLLLRTRRLVVTDDHLRSFVYASDCVTIYRITQAVTAKVRDIRPPSYARLLIESAAVPAHVAFDTWAEQVEAGDDADLVAIYRAVRTEHRRVVGG